MCVEIKNFLLCAESTEDGNSLRGSSALCAIYTHKNNKKKYNMEKKNHSNHWYKGNIIFVCNFQTCDIILKCCLSESISIIKKKTENTTQNTEK